MLDKIKMFDDWLILKWVDFLQVSPPTAEEAPVLKLSLQKLRDTVDVGIDMCESVMCDTHQTPLCKICDHMHEGGCQHCKICYELHEAQLKAVDAAIASAEAKLTAVGNKESEK